MEPRIAVVGAGAIGGYVGGHLARLGHDVVLIDAWPEHVESIRAHGLRISGMSPEESCTVKVPALHVGDVQSLGRERPIDIALIAVKSYDTDWATMLIRPYLAEGGYAVSLQNCINEPRIAAVVGWGRTVGCVAALIAAELHAPGCIRRTLAKGRSVDTAFRVGEVHGRITPRLERLNELLGQVDATRTTTNLWGERWSKLCVNAMRNGISAVTGLGGNARDRHAAVRRFSIQVGGEAVRIGQALGYSLESIGPLDAERLAYAAEGDAAALREVEARLLAEATSNYRDDAQRPSMAQDIAKGRRTEIDFINGYVVEQGGTIGRRAPANAALTELVRRVERADLAPRPENITQLPA